jgi:hypothetical protein
MIWWLLLAVYVIGVIPAWWILTGQVAWGMHLDGYNRGGLPGGGSIVVGAYLALCLASIWPVSLPIFVVVGRGGSSRMLYTPPKHRSRRDKEIRRVHEDRIRELEREAGIR